MPRLAWLGVELPVALGLALVGCILSLAIGAWLLRRPLRLVILFAYSLVLSQSYPVAQVGGRPLNISSDYVLIVLLAVAYGLSVMGRPKARVLLGRTAALYTLFCGVACISLVLSIARHGLAAHAGPLVEVAKWFLYSLVVVPVVRFVPGRAEARLVLRHMAIAGTLVMAVSLAQLLFIQRWGQPVSGTFGSLARQDFMTIKNSFGVYVAALTLALVLRLTHLGRDPWMIIFASLSAIVLFFSFSRSALVGFFCALIWLWFTSGRAIRMIRTGRAPRATPSLVGAGLVALAIVLVYSFFQDFGFGRPLSYLFGLFMPERAPFASRSFVLRVAKLVEAWPAFLERPLLGYGLFAVTVAYPTLRIADNFYMATLLDAGIVGLALMLALMASLWAAGRRGARGARQAGDHEALWLCEVLEGCLVILVVASVAGSYVHIGRLLGNLMLLLACTLAVVDPHETHTSQQPEVEIDGSLHRDRKLQHP